MAITMRMNVHSHRGVLWRREGWSLSGAIPHPLARGLRRIPSWPHQKGALCAPVLAPRRSTQSVELWCGHPRLSLPRPKGVDGRAKPGHDEMRMVPLFCKNLVRRHESVAAISAAFGNIHRKAIGIFYKIGSNKKPCNHDKYSF